jgi:type II secretory ATPase GspE/PulE/Tfp pilus assembly ATPase PilB-like protein
MQSAICAKDGFGLMPLSFRPGCLKKLLGHCEFVIDAEFIQIAEEKLSYENVQEVLGSNGQIELVMVDGRRHRLRCAGDHAALASLIQQLAAEYNEYQDYRKNADHKDIDAGMQFFARALDFRARPFVWAADILLTTAAVNHFSDIHLEPIDAESARLTFRAAGQIRQSLQISMQHQSRLLARFKFLAGCHSHIAETAQEGAFHQENFDVRLSTFPTDFGERAALRIITTLAFPDLDALGWPKALVESWRRRLSGKRGLFVISGPVGSGKTTAMYASLGELASSERGLRVVTVEDPVEAKIPGICQASLDTRRDNSLAEAFKHLLRQDPDVIALGEIRDSTCVKEALQAALSGHLILATFHAGSPTEAVDRIKQMGIEDYLVFSGLRGILHLELENVSGKLQPLATYADYQDVRMQKKL